jgi:site-specific recombinase XerD
MGRRAQGLRFRKQGAVWCVRFRVAKVRHEYSTGIKAESGQRRPSEAAVREGEQIFAAVLAGKRVVRANAAPRPSGSSANLAEAFAEWTGEIAVRAATLRQYDAYTVQWLREWRRSTEMTEPSIAAYFRRRLREVTRKSVQNETSALRQFSTWAVETGLFDVPIAVPTIPKGVNGTPYTERRRTRAPELSADEIEGILARLPEHSDARSPGERFPVKARFEVMWETTLRPASLDKLSVPEHWAPGERVLRVDDADDKEGFGRELPLTKRAQEALARVAPDAGLIFGAHKYFRYLGPAAAAVLPAAKARIFTGQHVRSAAITRALERSSNLAGTMFLAGHKHASTTSKYVRPTFRAAEAVLRAFSGEKTGEDSKSSAAK